MLRQLIKIKVGSLAAILLSLGGAWGQSQSSASPVLQCTPSSQSVECVNQKIVGLFDKAVKEGAVTQESGPGTAVTIRWVQTSESRVRDTGFPVAKFKKTTTKWILNRGQYVEYKDAEVSELVAWLGTGISIVVLSPLLASINPALGIVPLSIFPLSLLLFSLIGSLIGKKRALKEPPIQSKTEEVWRH